VAAPGWWCIELDATAKTVRVPTGVRLDFGATAKALAADRAAARVAAETGCGVLIGLGGDIAVAGPAPQGGWPVGVAVHASAPLHAVEQVISISEGGLASSSTLVRTWRRAGRRMHHIVDPLTGDVARECWTLVTVAASSCVEANTASTAAVVWGDQAPDRLSGLGLPARLVFRDGTVRTVGGWPEHDGPGERPSQ